MSLLSALPDRTVGRLSKVKLRTVHLVGIAGTFGNAMLGMSESIYITLAIYSGIFLLAMEVYSGWIRYYSVLHGQVVHSKNDLTGQCGRQVCC